MLYLFLNKTINNNIVKQNNNIVKQNMNVVLNVSGQHYEINKNILMQIPYFHDMFDVCDNDETKVIPVMRSPRIFRHIIEFLIDQYYPFPAKYAYKLDFYGIIYDKTKLYDKYQELINITNDNYNKTRNEIKNIKNEIENINIKIQDLRQSIESISDTETTVCNYDNCKILSCNNSIFCTDHKKCIVSDCCSDPQTGYNYCSKHYRSGERCDHGGCLRLRCGDYYNEYCDKHASCHT